MRTCHCGPRRQTLTSRTRFARAASSKPPTRYPAWRDLIDEVIQETDRNAPFGSGQSVTSSLRAPVVEASKAPFRTNRKERVFPGQPGQPWNRQAIQTRSVRRSSRQEGLRLPLFGEDSAAIRIGKRGVRGPVEE